MGERGWARAVLLGGILAALLVASVLVNLVGLVKIGSAVDSGKASAAASKTASEDAKSAAQAAADQSRLNAELITVANQTLDILNSYQDPTSDLAQQQRAQAQVFLQHLTDDIRLSLDCHHLLQKDPVPTAPCQDVAGRLADLAAGVNPFPP